jgi:hypothetical protein
MLRRAEVDLSQAIAIPGSMAPVGSSIQQAQAMPDEALASGHDSSVSDDSQDERGIWFPLDMYRLVEARLKKYKRNALSLKHGNSLVPTRTLLSFRCSTL